MSLLACEACKPLEWSARYRGQFGWHTFVSACLSQRKFPRKSGTNLNPSSLAWKRLQSCLDFTDPLSERNQWSQTPHNCDPSGHPTNMTPRLNCTICWETSKNARVTFQECQCSWVHNQANTGLEWHVWNASMEKSTTLQEEHFCPFKVSQRPPGWDHQMDLRSFLIQN